MLNVVLYTIFTTYMLNHYIDTFLYDLDIKDPLYKRNSVYKSIKSNFQEDYSAFQRKPFTYIIILMIIFLITVFNINLHQTNIISNVDNDTNKLLKHVQIN